MPDNADFDNGSRRSGSCSSGTSWRTPPSPYDFASGARGVRLAELGLRSSAEGRRIALEEQ
ncbi:hypothetical protein GCM10020219_000010 [Nonomuraea dietziae]